MTLDPNYLEEKNDETNPAYLVFSVNAQIYAVKASHVIEITPIGQIAPLPHVAPYILGVAKVHDIIYSVVDLRIRLGAEHHTASRPVVAIILTYKERKICVIVDKAIAVLNIDTRKMDLPAGGNDYVFGIVQAKNMSINLLSISCLYDF